MKKTYLDHNATTPLRPAARDALLAALDHTGNASSVHGFGRDARRMIENARGIIARSLDVSNGQVIFNSGASEGNTTILRGFAGKRILISSIEHPSIRDCGVETEKIPVTADGMVDMAAYEKMLHTGTPPALVSIMAVNNETGVIQPIADIARMAKSVGAIVHTDCVQAYGRIPFTRESLGVDALTLSSHKIGGPQGVGALVTAAGIVLPRLIEGGGQERRQRGGTENVAGIAAFGAAASEAVAQLESYAKLALLRDRIETHLRPSNRITIYGTNAPRVANTSMVTVSGVSGETLLMAFDLDGVALSAGSACSSGTSRFTHVLQAMGVEACGDIASLRISLGWNTTAADIDNFLSVWDKISTRLLKD